MPEVEDTADTSPAPGGASARQHPASLALAAAVVLLSAAILLAVKSRVHALFGAAGDPVVAANVEVAPWRAAGFLSYASCAVAIVVLATLRQTRRERLTGEPLRWRSAGVPALVALAAIVALSVGLPGYYATAMSSGAAGPSLPAAVGAWILTAAGCLAASAGAAAPAWRSGNTRWPAAGVALGLVVSTVVAATAAYAGDDDRFIDATTAPAADIPSDPTSLGTHRFSLTLPGALSADGHRPLYQIRPAGAGFVVSHQGAVSAYGADGQERWHYRRTGPGASAMSLRVYDGGATVVVADLSFVREPAPLIGLDAVTGEQLWQRRDAGLSRAFASDSGIYDPDPFLIDRNDQTWTQYDARTGRPVWTVRNPAGACRTHRTVDTGSRLAAVLRCEHDGVVDYRVMVADPRTGANEWQGILVEGLAQAQSYYDVDVYADMTGREGLLIEVRAQEPLPSNRFYVNTASKRMVPLPETGNPQTTTGPGEGLLVEGYDREARTDVLSLFGPDGQHRCTTTTPLSAGGSLLPGRQHEQVAYLVLRDGFVLYDFDRAGPNNHDGAAHVRVLNNTMCQPVAAQPTKAALGLIAAPGVVLVVRQDFPSDPETVKVDGYF